MNTANQPTSTSSSESCNTMGGEGRGKRPMHDLIALERKALVNALSGRSTMNYQAIIDGFRAKGVAVEDIKPRENVFTFHAWCGVGRCVKRGEHGVKVCTFVPMTRTDPDSGEIISFRDPRQTTVFHISQTEPLVPVQPAVAG